jgi:hemerythrin
MSELLSPTGFAWNDRYLLGHPGIDDTHREFVACVDALLGASDAELPAALAAFARHAKEHFTQEREWMDSGGPGQEFPARDCHVGEHEQVLASVREVQEQLAQGDCAIVRALAKALQAWFPGHADHMDSALAHWLVKRAHGGAPLVLKRNQVVR